MHTHTLITNTIHTVALPIATIDFSLLIALSPQARQRRGHAGTSLSSVHLGRRHRQRSIAQPSHADADGLFSSLGSGSSESPVGSSMSGSTISDASESVSEVLRLRPSQRLDARVLVVEDNVVHRLVAEKLCGLLFTRIECANNGRAALDLVGDSMGTDEAFDCISE